MPDASSNQQFIVVGPQGAAAHADPAAEEGPSPAELVSQPAKVMRIGTMTKQLLDEVRAAPLDEATLRASGAMPAKGPVKILTSCPSCLQGLSRYTGDLDNGLLEADYIVVEMANRILGEDWMPEYVARANEGGIERVLV